MIPVYINQIPRADCNEFYMEPTVDQTSSFITNFNISEAMCLSHFIINQELAER